MKEGYLESDFIKVIDNQYEAWKDKDSMMQYMRPSTLFCPSHFDEYLNNTKHKKTPEEIMGIK